MSVFAILISFCMKVFILVFSLLLFACAKAQNVRRLNATLYGYSSGSTSVLDGNVTVFDDQYSNLVDNFDVIKISNFSENFAIARGGRILVIEARKWTFVNDTINYRLWNLQPRQYLLQFIPERMDTAVLSIALSDSYLGSTIAISRSDTSQVVFSVNATPASYAANRFKIILKKLVQTWPIHFIDVNASWQDNRVEIAWCAAGDSRYYVVQHSLDGRQFFPVDTLQSNVNTQSVARYQFVHPVSLSGDNFYRIQGVDWTGESFFSNIIHLSPKASLQGFEVTNPIENKLLKLRFLQQPEGKYYMQLINNQGQVNLSIPIAHSKGNHVHTIRLPNLPPAFYTITIGKNKDLLFATKVLVK